MRAIARRAITAIATAFTSESAIGTHSTSNWDAAKIQATWRTESLRLPAPDEPPEADGDQGEHEGGPPVQHAEEIEQAFDGRDPECEAQATLSEPAPGTAGTMLDCGRSDHADQPYHAGTVTQTRPETA